MNGLNNFFSSRPYIIAGPCSAESLEQLDEAIIGIKKAGVNVIRAGVWKPRSRPNSFEGKGVEALKWLLEMKKKHQVHTAVEVANPEHVEHALAHEVDIIWIGARTSVNPFAVQELAEALKGVDIPVLVKNPINPDLPLWIGAIERIKKVGVGNIGAVHRGFSAFQPGKFRNAPVWQIPIELRRQMPEIPLFCDPSHISGERGAIKQVCQMAMDFNYDGIMVEVHPDPDNAMSDAQQQINPEALKVMLDSLKLRSSSVEDFLVKNKLVELRQQIDEIDRELIEVLARRMNIIDEIGKYKKGNNITVFQLERWKEIISSRPKWGEKLNISPQLVEDILKAIHTESLKRQTDILNDNE